jgi:hypothetical protein
VPAGGVRAGRRIGSTGKIIKTVEEAPPGTKWAIGTELHLVNRLKQEHPEQEIHFLSPVVCMCATMYRIDLAHLCWSLENLAAGTPGERHRSRRRHGPLVAGGAGADAGGLPKRLRLLHGTLILIQGHRLVRFDEPMVGVPRIGAKRQIASQFRLMDHPHGILSRPVKHGWPAIRGQIHWVVGADRQTTLSRLHYVRRIRCWDINSGSDTQVAGACAELRHAVRILLHGSKKLPHAMQPVTNSLLKCIVARRTVEVSPAEDSHDCSFHCPLVAHGAGADARGAVKRAD